MNLDLRLGLLVLSRRHGSTTIVDVLTKVKNAFLNIKSILLEKGFGILLRDRNIFMRLNIAMIWVLNSIAHFDTEFSQFFVEDVLTQVGNVAALGHQGASHLALGFRLLGEIFLNIILVIR